MTTQWRLINDSGGPGSWNMAVDEALLEGVRQGGTPFLRFYSWTPHTLSLGRFQNPESGLTAVVANVPRVRRLTGGGAIWHGDELTYSLGCRQADVGTAGVKPSLERLCSFLLATWRELGWNARFAKDEPTSKSERGSFSPACFAGHEEYDILVNGMKLGGNAQKRDREFIFQHGSLPLTIDWSILESLFDPDFCPQRPLVTDLRSCGWLGSSQDLIVLLASHFSAQMGVEVVPDSLTRAEIELAQRRSNERFSTQTWTEHGSGSFRDVSEERLR